MSSLKTKYNKSGQLVEITFGFIMIEFGSSLDLKKATNDKDQMRFSHIDVIFGPEHNRNECTIFAWDHFPMSVICENHPLSPFDPDKLDLEILETVKHSDVFTYTLRKHGHYDIRRYQLPNQIITIIHNMESDEMYYKVELEGKKAFYLSARDCTDISRKVAMYTG